MLKHHEHAGRSTAANIRIPLVERSNRISPPSSIRSPGDQTRKTRGSGRESLFYDTECVSHASITSIRRVSPRPIKIVASSKGPKPIEEKDLRSESPLSRLGTTPFLYGYGTELHPIKERHSISTLRTASYSASDLSSLIHCPLRYTKQLFSSGPIPQRLRRRQSFSLDDADYLQNYALTTSRRPPLPKLETIYTSASASDTTDGERDYNTHKYPFSPPYSPPTCLSTPKNILSMIESHDRQGDGHEAARTWRRLVRRSRCLSRGRTVSHHGRIIPDEPMVSCYPDWPPPLYMDTLQHGDGTQHHVAAEQTSRQNDVCSRCKAPRSERQRYRPSPQSVEHGVMSGRYRCRRCTTKMILRSTFSCGSICAWVHR